MPRTPRLDYPGARHHVMNRTLRKEAFFTTDNACSLMEYPLMQMPQRFGVRIHAWVLMPNHYHLLIETPSGNLSKAMKFLGSTLTQQVNQHRGIDGPFFRGRFKNRVVEDDSYWQHLLAYLHLNPVAAHLCPRPEDWIWSSHNAYMGEALTPDWLTTSDMISSFGSRKAIAQYIRDVRTKRSSAPTDFDAERLWIPGTTEVTPEPEIPVPPRQRTIDEAINEVATLLDVPRADLLKLPRRPGGNPPAWMAIWWATRCTGLTQRKVGSHWGLSRVRVSQITKSLFKLSRKDPRIDPWMYTLEDTL